MRSFIAINLSDEIKNMIQDDIYKFKRRVYGVKWVDKNKLHLTLKFLGDIKKDKKVIKMLKEIKIEKFDILFNDNYGYFSSRGTVKVLHLPIEKTSNLLKLNSVVEEKMNLIGIKKEKREFFPHITIGRVKRGRLKDSDLNEVYNDIKPDFDKFKVCKFDLMKSELTHKGPIYSKIKEFELK